MAYRTFGDLVKVLRAYVGNDASDTKAAAVRRAAQAAFRTLLTYHPWAYYLAIGRVVTVAPYSTGTVQYVNSTRALTLSGGTWPSWAASGMVRINNVYHEVATRDSGTVLTLEATSNPGADVDAGAAFEIVRCVYDLPADFLAADQLVVAGNQQVLMKFQPRDFVFAKNLEEGPATPREFTFVGSPAKNGRMAVEVWPPPDALYNLEFLYKRRPAAPKLEDESGGTAAVTAASAVVTGTGTSFTARMVGSVLRLSADATKPTADDGTNPFVFESRVASYQSATQVTLEDAATETLSGVGLTVSDQVDVEDGEMWHLLIELARKELRIDLRMNATDEEPEQFERVVRAAKAAEGQRHKARVVAGTGRASYGYGEYPTRTDQ